MFSYEICEIFKSTFLQSTSSDVQQETLRNFYINATLFEKYSPRTTISFLLLRNEKIKPKSLLEIL